MKDRSIQLALWLSPPLVAIYARVVSVWYTITTPGYVLAVVTLYQRFGSDSAQVITHAAREAARVMIDSAADFNTRANGLIVWAAQVSDVSPGLTADQVAHQVRRYVRMMQLLPLEFC